VPGPFVINLCSSTTPMALSQPASPELKRFTFFVSRRLEDGRERFRLHMGYFETLQEAEEWLNIVRDVYPGAWAGETPGKRLRERAAAEATGQAAASTPAPASRPTPTARATQPSRSTVPPGVVVPTLRAAAPEARGVTNARTTAPTPSRPVVPSAPAVSRRPPAVPPQRPAVATAPAAKKPPAPGMVGQQRAMPRNLPPAPAARGAPHSPGPAKPVTPGSNVREVLAALDDTGATRQMPAPNAAPPARVPASAPRSGSSLSDSQVLRILEERRGNDGASEVTETGISLLKPDDTGTRQALKEAVSANAPVSFAVQLNWSVQPIDLAKVPPLAIFSAYTLYAVEGSREGRRWYGLRLGFFSDAISAKQVAYYVRSEFSSVAVVPVSPKERERASTSDKRSAVARAPSAAVQDKLPLHASSEFKLFDDTTETPKLPQGPQPAPAAPRAAPAQAAPATPKRAEAPAAGAKRGGKGSGGKVRGRDQRRPQSLEETLEILGADQLEIDSGRELLNDTGVRHLKMSVQKNTPFTRLLDRLSERLNKN
jgi:hypothetical protein